MATDPKDALWSVVDTNATALKPNSADIMPRVHDLRPGVRYELYSDKATSMPERDARMFLKDAAFIVRNADGNEVRPLTELQTQRMAPQERLPPDTVIATLEELTDDALRTRCQVHPQADTLPAKADRATMIDFLLGLMSIGATPRRGNDDRVDGEGSMEPDADPAETAFRLLEGA